MQLQRALFNIGIQVSHILKTRVWFIYLLKKRLVYHQPVEALNPQLLINNEPSIFKGALLPYVFMIINESEIKMFCICILCEAMVSL